MFKDDSFGQRSQQTEHNIAKPQLRDGCNSSSAAAAAAAAWAGRGHHSLPPTPPPPPPPPLGWRI